jgi:DNA-binding IclR family transcriptional regulator
VASQRAPARLVRVAAWAGVSQPPRISEPNAWASRVSVSRRTYRLGFSLVAVGRAALDQHPVMALARRECSELAASLGLECLASVNIAETLLIVADAGRPEWLHVRPRTGQRLPFMPLLGILGAAYLEPDDLDAWLSRIGPGATAADRASFRDAAVRARAAGRQVELETPTRQKIGMLMPELAQVTGTSAAVYTRLRKLISALGREEHTLVDPEPGRSYAVNNIQAPILGSRGGLVAGLVLLGFGEPLSAERITELVDTLTPSTERITRVTGGRAPVSL